MLEDDKESLKVNEILGEEVHWCVCALWNKEKPGACCGHRRDNWVGRLLLHVGFQQHVCG